MLDLLKYSLVELKKVFLRYQDVFPQGLRQVFGLARDRVVQRLYRCLSQLLQRDRGCFIAVAVIATRRVTFPASRSSTPILALQDDRANLA